MDTISNVEGLLTLKLNQISNMYSSENTILYQIFYGEIKNDKLREIFTILHSQLNDLFSFMNQKNSPGFGGHYNADESRDLIELIKQLRLLQANLKDEYSFDIDIYYKNILNSCKPFLSVSKGSPIPIDFPIIDLIEGKPIFTFTDSIAVPGPVSKSSAKTKLIGEGSYAKVFKYKDSHYGCHFAIKRANEDLSADELNRFKYEYKDLETLDSPFIIKAYNYNEEKNEYTMEYADCTLEKFINKNNTSLSFKTRQTLIVQLLNAFEYIHKKGILHRDISYQNVLIKNFDDGSTILKVSDFGLVKRPESTLTKIGTEIKGAINDYSDLSIVGFENYEIRHETYALAKVIYFIISGRQTDYNREENTELKNFILKAISPEKENRFTSIEEIRTALTTVVFPAIRLAIQNKK